MFAWTEYNEFRTCGVWSVGDLYQNLSTFIYSFFTILFLRILLRMKVACMMVITMSPLTWLLSSGVMVFTWDATRNTWSTKWTEKRQQSILFYLLTNQLTELNLSHLLNIDAITVVVDDRDMHRASLERNTASTVVSLFAAFSFSFSFGFGFVHCCTCLSTFWTALNCETKVKWNRWCAWMVSKWNRFRR